MRIHLGTDYNGYELARSLQAGLTAEGHDVQWHGAQEYDEGDDYPYYSIGVAQSVVKDEDDGVQAFGVICGKSGAGEVIAANKVNGARAITATEEAVAHDGRNHADANILTLGSVVVPPSKALELVRAFISTPFTGSLDDARRIVNTAEFETSSTIEGWNLS